MAYLIWEYLIQQSIFGGKHLKEESISTAKLLSKVSYDGSFPELWSFKG